jgi:hypothetical protein
MANSRIIVAAKKKKSETPPLPTIPSGRLGSALDALTWRKPSLHATRARIAHSKMSTH